MVYLTDFSPSQQQMMVRYLWQVGMWISDLDDDGANEGMNVERKALLATLRRLHKNGKAAAFIRDAAAEAAETLEGDTPDFNHDTFVDDLMAFLKAMRGTWSRHAFRHYAHTLVYLARAVAMADREDIRDDMGIDIPPETFFERLFAPVTRLFADKKQQQLMNISPIEDQAINDLIDAIRTVSKPA